MRYGFNCLLTTAHIRWNGTIKSRVYNRAVRCRFAQIVLLLATCLLAALPALYAQSTIAAKVRVVKSETSCPSPSVAGGKYTLSDLAFSNVARMPVPEQERIIASLKHRMYSGTPDEITEEVLERVKGAWQNRGYFRVETRGEAKKLDTISGWRNLSFSICVDEGPQYKLAGITFKNTRAITNPRALRSQFPIKDGDVFSRGKIGRGLEQLRFA